MKGAEEVDLLLWRQLGWCGVSDRVVAVTVQVTTSQLSAWIAAASGSGWCALQFCPFAVISSVICKLSCTNVTSTLGSCDVLPCCHFGLS